jgi:hypothetical protein
MANKGIHMTLMMGPIIPLPAPAVVMDALESIEIKTAAGSTEDDSDSASSNSTPTRSSSGFKMTLQCDSRSTLNRIFVILGAQSVSPALPALRILVVVTINGTAQPVFDGVLTNVQMQPSLRGSAGNIIVFGEDLTRVMDGIDWSGLPFPAMPIEARVALICAKYAPFGILPLVIPTIFFDAPIPIEEIPAQQGTDLEYIEEMAGEVGYVFYIEPGPVAGTNIAYFGPEIKVGVPQPALNVDMDALTNVESIDFKFDPEKGVLPIVYIQNKLTRAPIPIPVPDINPLQPPLGLLPTPIANVRNLKYTAKLKPLKALERGVVVASRTQDAVSAEGTLNVLRYGRPLKARQLVGVRGAGFAYDGLYYVQSVTSTLKHGEFKQSFKLTRNGLISTVPRVVP